MYCRATEREPEALYRVVFTSTAQSKNAYEEVLWILAINIVYIPERVCLIMHIHSTVSPSITTTYLTRKQLATLRWFARRLITGCTDMEFGENESGSSGRQTGKYWSLSSRRQNRVNTARQKINLVEMKNKT